LRVLDISRLRLRHAELTYLSACGTTRTSANLADEAIHITAAFQIVASLAEGIPVDLRDALTGIDATNLDRVIRAAQHAGRRK
jgi:hypothetical protein